MKKILMVAMALCFVFAVNYETYSQKRKIAKQPVKRKLVKCRVNGKIVYRTRCRTANITNPELTLQNPQIELPDEKFKYPTYGGQGSILSDGRGTGNGTGTGNGNGAGAGNGRGNGIGTGNGNTQQTEQRAPLVTQQNNLTSDLKIISKPRAPYTDAARTNMVQGVVRLKVTFLANGQIGAIVPIKGLPNGLTNQAVNAARAVRFEPARRKGKPFTVVKILEYSFTIY